MPAVVRGELTDQAASLSIRDSVEIRGKLALNKRKAKGVELTDYYIEAAELWRKT